MYSADAAGIPKKAISAASTFLKADLPTTTVFNDQANTYTAGSKQTHQNSATTSGFNIAPSSDPSTLANGDLWLSSSTTDALKYRSSATTYVLQSSKGIAQLTTVAGPLAGAASGTAFVQAGTGATFTPTQTGRVLVTVTGEAFMSNTASGSLKLSWGTGTAPTNGATATGTVVGATNLVASTTTHNFFTSTVVITGLTAGTAYWIDPQIATGTSTRTISISNLDVTIVET